MANVKFTELAAIGLVSEDDILPIVDTSETATKTVTVAKIAGVMETRNNTFTGTENIFEHAPIYTLPHGTFYSSVTQNIANILNTQPIAFEKESDVHLFTHSTSVNTHQITTTENGSYEIIFSGVADTTPAAGTNKVIEVWIALNGTPVADSNTRINIATTSTEMTVCVSWLLDCAVGDIISLETWGDNVGVEWKATAAGTNPTRPATPSVIMTIKKISDYPADY